MRNEIASWLKELRSQDAIDERTAREMEDHFRCAIAKRMDGGDSPEEAFAAAKAEFGNLSAVNDEVCKVHPNVPALRKLLWLLVGYTALQSFVTIIANSRDILSLCFLRMGVQGIVEIPWSIVDPFHPDLSETNSIAASVFLSHIIYYGTLLLVIILCIDWMRSPRNPLLRFTQWVGSSRRRFLVGIVILAGIGFVGFSPGNAIEHIRHYIDIAFPWHWEQAFMQFFRPSEETMGMSEQAYGAGRLLSLAPQIAWILPVALAVLCFSAVRAISIDRSSSIAWGIAGYFLIQITVAGAVWLNTVASSMVHIFGVEGHWNRPMWIGSECLCILAPGAAMAKLCLSRDLITRSVLNCRMAFWITEAWSFFHAGLGGALFYILSMFAYNTVSNQIAGPVQFLQWNFPKIASIALVVAAFVACLRFQEHANNEGLTA